MTTIKSYTDLEQSKKLSKILPLESADMFYDGVQDLYKEKVYNIPMNGSSITVRTGHIITEKGIKANLLLPAWSLEALLEAMPKSIPKYIESEKCQKTFHLNLFRSYYHCCSYSFAPSISDDDGSNTLYCVGRDNWVDACYELVLKLNELNLL